MDWNAFLGILLGFCSFAVIGVFHPIVIKAEYYFTEKCWPVFLIAGIAFCLGSFFLGRAGNFFFSTLLAIVAFSCFWSIKELKEQTQRVEKGWFPKNPNRK